MIVPVPIERMPVTLALPSTTKFSANVVPPPTGLTISRVTVDNPTDIPRLEVLPSPKVLLSV